MFRSISAIVLSLGLLAGDAVECAGWVPTPEARMACCVERVGCPMHPGDALDSTSVSVVNQTQADACCAASEHGTSGPSTPTFVTSISSVVVGAGVALPVAAPALVLSSGWRMAGPIPSSPIPKHVLLSVYLL